MSIRPSSGLVRLCFQLLGGFEAISRGRIPSGCKTLYPLVHRSHQYRQIAHWLRLNGLPDEASRFEHTVEDSFQSIHAFLRRFRRPPNATEAADLAGDAVNLLRALADMLVGSAQGETAPAREHIDEGGDYKHSRRVALRGREEEPIVLGKTKRKLTLPQYNVVKALLDAGDVGLTKDELVSKSGHEDARGILTRLAKKDPDWKQVIHFAGQTGGGYRIK